MSIKLPNPADAHYRGEWKWKNTPTDDTALRFVPGIDSKGKLVWVRPAVFQSTPNAEELPLMHRPSPWVHDPHGCAEEFIAPPAEEAQNEPLTPEMDAAARDYYGPTGKRSGVSFQAVPLGVARRLEQDRNNCLAKLQEIAKYQGWLTEATPEESARSFLQLRHTLLFLNDAIEEALQPPTQP
jgi:hypothetical protein